MGLVLAELLHGQDLTSFLDNGDVDLAAGLPLRAVLTPSAGVVGLETVVEVGVLVPGSAGAVLGPFVSEEFLGGFGVLRAGEPVGGELAPEVGDLRGVEGGAAAVRGP